MSFFYETPGFVRRSINDYTAPFGDAFGAAVRQAWHEGPVASLFALDELSQARTGRSLVERFIPGLGMLADEARGGPPTLTNVLSEDDFKQRVDGAGLQGMLKHRAGMREAELDILIREKRKELDRKSTLARADKSLATEAGLFGAGLLGSFADPINLATAFIPFVGPSRYALKLGEAGTSALARAGVRARVGATEGFLGTAITEPLVAHAMSEQQQEYGAAQIFMNLVFGTAIGGGLHMGAGNIMDRVARRGEFFRETGRYYDQAYASFVNDYRGIATEYGFDTSLAGFQSRLLGKLGDGFFGPQTKKLFDTYVSETNRIANELGLPPPGRSPEDFMRWIDTRHNLRAPLVPDEKHADPRLRQYEDFNAYHAEARAWAKEFGVEPPPAGAKAFEAWVAKHEFIGPPARQTPLDKAIFPERDLSDALPAYEAPSVGTFKTYYQVGDVAKTPVASLPVVNRLSQFADEIPPQAREVGMWHAANRFVQGQIADLRPMYQLYGAQKRMTEARELATPRVQEIVGNFKGTDARVTPQLLDGKFAYKLDFGDTGPRAYLHPEGLRPGDRVEWSRFGANQLGDNATAKVVSVSGDKAKIEGWGREVPLSELKLIEAGPAARKHTLEIEWGDLGITLKANSPVPASVAKVQAGDRLLQVLRGDQKFDAGPVMKQLEHQDNVRSDMLYAEIDPRERIGAIGDAESIVSRRNEAPDGPIPLPKSAEPETKLDKAKGSEAPTQGRKSTGGEEPTIRTPEEDRAIVEHDSIASQKADQFGLRQEYNDMMAKHDKEIAEANERAYFLEHYARCIMGEV